MHKDDILRLARAAGFDLAPAAAPGAELADLLQRFAALVGAAEREACARTCESVEALYDRTAVGYWDFHLPTECEEAASRGARECASAIRQRRLPGTAPDDLPVLLDLCP